MGIAAPETPADHLAKAAFDTGWDEAIEFCAEIADKWQRADHIRLHAGEMTAQELRSVQAVVRAVASEIRAP